VPAQTILPKPPLLVEVSHHPYPVKFTVSGTTALARTRVLPGGKEAPLFFVSPA
jgi:hypothetical protein